MISKEEPSNWSDKSEFNKVYNFFKEHEYECLQLAEHNVCLTHAAKKEMLAWNNLPNQPLKIEVIPCSADLELFDPGKITEADKTATLNNITTFTDTAEAVKNADLVVEAATENLDLKLKIFKQIDEAAPANTRFLVTTLLGGRVAEQLTAMLFCPWAAGASMAAIFSAEHCGAAACA